MSESEGALIKNSTIETKGGETPPARAPYSGRPRGRPRGRTVQATWVELRERLFRVVTHMDNHPELDGDGAILAEMAGMSRSHFIRCYGHYVGESPNQTLMRLRLTRARARLAAGSSVTEAGELAGYSSAHTFSLAFKNQFGRCPSKITFSSQLPAIPPRLVWFDERPMYGVSARGERLKFTPAIANGLSTLARKCDWRDTRHALVLMGEVPFFAGEGGEITLAPREIERSNDPEGAYDAAIDAKYLATTRGLDRITIAGGLYLFLTAHGDWRKVSDLIIGTIGRVRGARYALRSGPILWRGINDPWMTPPSERLRELYVPLRRQ